MKNTNMNLKQWTLLLTLATLWGTSFIFNEIILTEMKPLTAAHIALAIGAAMIIIYGPKNTIFTTKLPWKNLAIMGILNTAMPFCLIINAQIHITAATAAILVAITPFSTIILAHIFIREEPLTLKKIIGIISATAGLTFILNINPLSGDTNNLSAKIMIIGATLCYATATIFAKLKFKNIPFKTAAAGQLITAAIILLPVAIIIEKPWNEPIPNLNAIGAILGVAILGTALAYTIYFKLIQTTHASNVSLVAIFIPLATLLFDWIFLNEIITQNQIIGLILIIFGMIIMDGRLIQKIRPKKYTILSKQIRK